MFLSSNTHPLMPPEHIPVLKKRAEVPQTTSFECRSSDLSNKKRTTIIVGNNAKSKSETRHYKMDIIETKKS